MGQECPILGGWKNPVGSILELKRKSSMGRVAVSVRARILEAGESVKVIRVGQLQDQQGNAQADSSLCSDEVSRSGSVDEQQEFCCSFIFEGSASSQFTIIDPKRQSRINSVTENRSE